MRTKEAFLSCLLCLSVTAGDAAAAILNPGNIVPLFGTTAAARPELDGVVLEDTLRPFLIDMGGGLSITGTVQDRVVRSDIDGTLDFYYQIANDATSDGSILFANRTDYSGMTTDVDWRIDGLGIAAPTFAFRQPSGNEVAFFFTSLPIGPGADSRFFFIDTDATAYDEGGQGLLAGVGSNGHGASVMFSTFQPVVVPLPNALYMFVAGLMGLMLVKRRGDAAT
jgi:hypothetical protein